MRATMRQTKADSFAEARTFWLILALALPAILLPLVVRAIDANGDNLDDAWEAQYGITTNVYDPGHLVGWWQMDGGTNVVDRSTNHIDGVIDGVTTNFFAPGLFSNALNVVPPLTVVFPPRPELVTTNGFTFSAWFKAADDTTNAATIATWNCASGASWQLGVKRDGTAAMRFVNGAPVTTEKAVPVSDAIPLYDAGWHHIAATWTSAGLATLYVDGEEQGNTLIPNWTPGEIPSFVLAGQKDGDGASYLLDETRLYNRALTAKEIAQLPVTYTDLNGNGVSVFDAAQRHLNPYAPFPGVSPHAPQLATNAAPQDAALKWTPWLSNPELDKFLSQFDSNPPGHHPNYWDKGHWITAVEGRWANNRIEYRIAYGPVPPHSHSGWYWWINQREDTFQKRAANYAAHGFTLEHSNFFTRPTGEKRYQGVWHWYIPPGASDPASKAALQRALEENQPQKL